MNTQEQRLRLLAQRRYQRQLRRRRSLSLVLLAAVTVIAVGFLLAKRPARAGAEGPAAAVQPEEAAMPETAFDLSLVNADHVWNGAESDTLVSVYDYKLDSYNVRDTELLLEERVIAPLNDMLADFDAATGCEDLLICAGYRTVEDQQYLWDRSMETYGAQHTQDYIARPGASEHHTGLALDFSMYDVSSGDTYDFEDTEESAWILEHCWEYGFIQRYPEGKADITGIATEPWHFRYVGQPHAYLIHQKGFCLEEYIEFLQQYPDDGTPLTVEYEGCSYEIWYCAESDIHYPETGSYSVSLDNCGGAVITVRYG